MGKTEQRIAQWIVETSFESIPPDAVRVVKGAVFDQVGVTLAGSVQPVGKIILKYGRDAGGTPESSAIGGGFKTSAAQAALLNGTSGHALDYDDVGGWGHPSTVLFPTVMGVGEKVGAPGRAILEAYIVGFEVAYNLSRGGQYNQMLRGFHSTSLFGTMAATAAASKLLKLNEKQTMMAMGIAGSMASGIGQNFGTMVGPLHAGMAARNGVMAALLAQEGLIGTAEVFEGRIGWAHAIFGEGQFDTEKMVKGLGSPFNAQDLIAFKKFPCCYGNHSMLDALLGVMKENNVKYADIARVEIGNMGYLSPAMMYGKPATGLEGKYSMLYNAAVGISEGTPRIEHYTDERVKDSKLQEAMDKVRVEVVSKWDPSIADGMISASANPVTIHLKSGKVVSKTVPREKILATRRNPWGEESLQGKFKENAALVLSKSRVEEAATVWRNVDQVGDIRQALDAVRGEGK